MSCILEEKRLRAPAASWREALVLAHGVHLAFHLIEALGHPIHPGSKRMICRSPATMLAALLWRLSRVRSFRELLATGAAECRALIGTMLAAAPNTVVPVPVDRIGAMTPKCGGRGADRPGSTLGHELITG